MAKVEVNKIEILEEKIHEYVTEVLMNAAKNNNIDHLEINIVNHKGTLQMESVLKNRDKAY
jgi:hypothetical protein